MSKLDVSCGLASKQIDRIKFLIKKEVGFRLPAMPEPVEIKLFFQGRDAWTYSWALLDYNAQHPLHQISVKVGVKLKKEFHQYQLRTHYSFICKLEQKPDLHSQIKLKSIHDKSN